MAGRGPPRWSCLGRRGRHGGGGESQSQCPRMECGSGSHRMGTGLHWMGWRRCLHRLHSANMVKIFMFGEEYVHKSAHVERCTHTQKHKCV